MQKILLEWNKQVINHRITETEKCLKLASEQFKISFFWKPWWVFILSTFSNQLSNGNFSACHTGRSICGRLYWCLKSGRNLMKGNIYTLFFPVRNSKEQAPLCGRLESPDCSQTNGSQTTWITFALRSGVCELAPFYIRISHISSCRV